MRNKIQIFFFFILNCRFLYIDILKKTYLFSELFLQNEDKQKMKKKIVKLY